MTMLENKLDTAPISDNTEVVTDNPDMHTVLGAAAPLNEYDICANITLEEQGPTVTREPVTRDDLQHVLNEAWFHAYLRKGAPHIRFEDAEFSLQPMYKAEDAARHIITAYIIIATLPDGTTHRRAFTPHSIPYASQRGGERLLAAGQLNSKKTFFYDFEMIPHSASGKIADAPAEHPDHSFGGITIVEKSPPMRWITVPLAPLLESATQVEEHDTRNHYVFYTAAARERLEHFSRLGMQQSPAVETGAALVGTLAVCPDSNDMFAIVTDALQITDSDATEMSLEYTSESWQRISTIIDAMGLNLMGQGHGHNFMPGKGAQPCEACALAEKCSTTSVFASTDDLNWTRAVFPHEPFALCHIFGLTARHMRPNADQVDTLYSIGDGRLLPRGYHVIDSFDHKQFECIEQQAN